MIEKIEKRLRRFRIPQSIEEAARQLYPRSLVDRLQADTAMDDLLEGLALETQEDSSAVLAKIAERLQIPAFSKLSIPSRTLVERTRISVSELQRHFAIPQPSEEAPFGFVIACATPKRSTVSEFESRGIPIALALGSDVRQAWEIYHHSDPKEILSESQVHSVLHQLVKDSRSLGAREVFLGHPDDGGYEFFAHDRRFAGRLHPSVYRQLTHQLRNSSRKVSETNPAGVHTLSYALTKSFSRTIVCLTWEEKIENPRKQETASPGRPNTCQTGTF